MAFLFRSKNKSSQHLKSFIAEKFGIKVKKVDLYEEAVLHKSIARDTNKDNNERLEFLGDAVLDMIVAEQLYEMYPQKTEGELTQLKARIVNRKTLGTVGLEMGLEKVVQFVDGKYVNKSTICGNAFEALVGAIYVDRGFEKTKDVVRSILVEYLNYNKIVQNDPDYKSQILVWSQKNKLPISFEEVLVEDLGHEKMYHFEIRCEEEVIGSGKGKSKKMAEQNASKSALKHPKTQ